jgi:hypothetical protein
MKTKKSIRQRVQETLSQKSDGLSVATIHSIAAPKSPIQSVYSVLWVMRKKGQVQYNPTSGLYYPPEEVQTASQQVDVRVDDEPEINGTGVLDMDWKAAYKVLGGEYMDVQREYEDALVVIKWLETKVENLIRAQVA